MTILKYKIRFNPFCFRGRLQHGKLRRQCWKRKRHSFVRKMAHMLERSGNNLRSAETLRRFAARFYGFWAFIFVFIICVKQIFLGTTKFGWPKNCCTVPECPPPPAATGMTLSSLILRWNDTTNQLLQEKYARVSNATSAQINSVSVGLFQGWPHMLNVWAAYRKSQVRKSSIMKI